jgi:hypothetical protein
MLNCDNIKQELDELTSEGFIKSYSISHMNSGTHMCNRIKGFTMISLEGSTLEVELTSSDCYLLKVDGKVYENFEQILRRHSNGYVEKFNEKIKQKLEMMMFDNEKDKDGDEGDNIDLDIDDN